MLIIILKLLNFIIIIIIYQVKSKMISVMYDMIWFFSIKNRC